jgi:hypothetical protein
VGAWSRVEAQLALVARWITENGPLNQDGLPQPAAELLLRLERLAADLRGRLGLDPASRARIERDLAAGARDLDLSNQLADGRSIRAKHESGGAS